jgi:hypothetical protein
LNLSWTLEIVKAIQGKQVKINTKMTILKVGPKDKLSLYSLCCENSNQGIKLNKSSLYA